MPTKGDPNDPKKPHPRRLFSFDSVKSGGSSRRSSSDHDYSKAQRSGVNPSDLSDVREGENEGEIVFSEKQPMFFTEPDNVVSSDPARVTSPTMKSRLQPRRQAPLAPKRPFTPENQTPAASPTRARWDSLRQHVLPTSRPSTPSQRPASPASSFAQSGRSTTPKPSRLVRLGFKQVVENAWTNKEVVDEVRKLGEEIMQACTAARYVDPQTLAKEKVPNSASTTTLGSTTSSNSANTNAGGKKFDYLRRPQSIMSLATPQAGVNSSCNTPTLRILYQLLVYHSGLALEHGMAVTPHLPHENHVLATLLCPFLMSIKYPAARLEEEKWIAIETFEILFKSWVAPDDFATTERCLWCTKVAGSLAPGPLRSRILAPLWRILVPGDRNRIALSVHAYQTIASGLLGLLAALHHSSVSSPHPGYISATPSRLHETSHPDIQAVQDIILQFLSGSLGELDEPSLEEEFTTQFSNTDKKLPGFTRRVVFLDALVNSLEFSKPSSLWMLNNLVDEYWPEPSAGGISALQATISCRKLDTFCRVASRSLKQFVTPPVGSPASSPMSRTTSAMSDSSDFTLDMAPNTKAIVQKLVSVIQTRVIPEATAFDPDTGVNPNIVSETRIHVVEFLLDLISLEWEGDAVPVGSPKEDIFAPTGDTTKEVVRWGVGVLCKWYGSDRDAIWKTVLEQALQRLIADEWDRKLRVLSAMLKHFTDPVRKVVFSLIIPALNDQLVDDPPPYPSLALSSFLSSLSRIYPPLFYKPLFACAASDKEFTVVNHLCTLQAHSKYVKDYWFRDVDMMCFALLGDAGDSGPSGMPGQIGVVRLGQLVLLVELIGQVQDIRHEKEGAGSSSDSIYSALSKFFSGLEGRLHLVIEAKECTILLPPSHRMLFCILFREFRLLTRSSKPAPWLSRMTSWFLEYCEEEDMDDFEQDVSTAMERVQGLYMAAQAGVQQGQKRHTSMLAAMSPKTAQGDSDPMKAFDLAATFVEHRKLIDSLSKGFPSRALKLFVAMSTLIPNEDYRRLGPLLWQHFLVDNADPSITSTACFLVMQCAEKTSMDLLAMIEVDLRASDDATRLEAVRKVSILVNWRFQIMSQNFINDRSHRPFKLARPPLPFLATDLGTSLYIAAEEVNENKDKDDVPLELKKRLAELGWTEEDAGPVDPWQESIETPLSLLPINQIDRLEVGTNDINALPLQISPHPSPKKAALNRDHLQAKQSEDLAALLRRNSSSGGPVSSVRRRAIFVPALTAIFMRLVTLASDSSYSVACAARATLTDLMRNDPGLLTRPILDFLTGEHKDIQLALHTFDTLLHIRRVLPPSLTHNVFNNFAGYLKLATRQVEDPSTLMDFAVLAPTTVEIATQVSGMTIREIRRSKLEHLFMPSGALWFPQSAPRGPMFPRNIGPHDPFDPLPQRLCSMTMIRTSQNMFFLTMLKRNYHDYQAIRKHMERLVLPSLEDYPFTQALDAHDFIIQTPTTKSRYASRASTVENISLMLSRSYILLVAQIFRSMSRHANDRHELAILIDGLNRTLLAHGSDINLLSQVLIGKLSYGFLEWLFLDTPKALMVASTRFRRLFSAGGAYALFMPALMKLYTESPSHPGIRMAIEYAVSRFYALHKESFLFQSLDAIGQVAMLDLNVELFSEGVYNLFFSLRKPATSSTLDVAGIREATKSQERQAVMIDTAEEKPQTFLSAIRRVETQTGLQMSFQLPEEHEGLGLKMEDLIKLFLTVIAHDPTIARAQHFLRVLRYLTPCLYNASNQARKTLIEGIGALGPVLIKTFNRPRHPENIIKPVRSPGEDIAFLPSQTNENSTSEKSRVSSDGKAMRLDYLHLLLAFGRAGGQLPLPIAVQGLEVLKVLLRDWSEPKYDALADFLAEFLGMLLIREDPPPLKAVISFLRDLSPILHAFMVAVDFTGVFAVVLRLCRIPMYAHDPAFGQVVVGEICSAGLAACDLAASENYLMTLRCRPIIIDLLAEAIFLQGVDVVSELEKRAPTYQYLAGVLLPLTCTMKTGSQLIADSLRTPVNRRVQQAAWVRLLYYCMDTCEKSRKDDSRHNSGFRGLGGSFRSKASDKGQSEGTFWRSHLPTFVTALQVVKVIIIRCDTDISVPRFAIWERLAGFIKHMLEEGTARFAFQSDISSAATTPAGSPRASAQFQPSSSGANLFVSTSFSRPTSPLERKAYSRPRLVDYALWSMLEFISAYRSPLRTQLKLFTMEKVLALDRDLRHQEVKSAVLSPYPISPNVLRASTGIFSKSRKRSSALPLSAGPSPDASPLIHPTSSNLLPVPSMLDIPGPRRPGYQASPVTPQKGHPGLPKIVHLGPTSPSAFAPTASPLLGFTAPNYKPTAISPDEEETSPSANNAKATKIRSIVLIQKTYQRIRGVQAFMGYSLLLPLPGYLDAVDEEVPVETWTKRQALEAIVIETQELLAEFEEVAAKYGLEDSVIVDVDPPATPFSTTSFSLSPPPVVI